MEGSLSDTDPELDMEPEGVYKSCFQHHVPLTMCGKTVKGWLNSGVDMIEWTPSNSASFGTGPHISGMALYCIDGLLYGWNPSNPATLVTSQCRITSLLSGISECVGMS